MNNKTKKILSNVAIFLLLTLIWNILAYGMFAFILLSVNPVEWSECARAEFVFLGCLCGMFVAGNLTHRLNN